MKRLCILNPGHAMEVPFDQQLTIGRDVYNSLSLQDSDISRSHAIIFEQDGKVIIKDLNSRNGVYLNGDKVTEQSLRDGDEITLGQTVIIFNPPEEWNKEKNLSTRAEYILKREIARRKADQADPMTIFTPEQMDKVVRKLFNQPEGATFFTLTNALALLRAFYEMVSAPNTNELFRKTLIRAMGLIGGDRGVIMESDLMKKKLKVRSIISHEENATKIEIPRQVLKVVHQGESCVFCPNVLDDERFAKIVTEDGHPIYSFIAAPILCEKAYFGFVYLDIEHRSRGYDYVAMRSLYFIATMVAALLQPRTMHFSREAPREPSPEPAAQTEIAEIS